MLPLSHFTAFNDTKSESFSNALRVSSFYVYQLHTWTSRLRIGKDPSLICAQVL